MHRAGGKEALARDTPRATSRGPGPGHPNALTAPPAATTVRAPSARLMVSMVTSQRAMDSYPSRCADVHEPWRTLALHNPMNACDRLRSARAFLD